MNIHKFSALMLIFALGALGFSSIVFAQTVTWTGNGTTNGLCNSVEVDPNLPAGVQVWQFNLTQPDTGPHSLTYDFDDGTQGSIEPTSVSGVVHFHVTTSVGAALLSASAVNGKSNSNLVISHCKIGPDLPPPFDPIDPLIVEKTAETSYTRTWVWQIEKTADQSDLGELDYGNSAEVNYSIKVSAISGDSMHKITGTITITNPAPNTVDAVLESVNDELDISGSIEVICDDDSDEETPFSFPYTLEPGNSIECSYEADVDGADDTLNTATANVSEESDVEGSFDEVDVIWGDPSEEINECITVSDTNANGPQNMEVCADDLDENGEYIFDDYLVTFSKTGDNEETDVVWECDQTEYVNIASFVANDTEATGDSDWAVAGYINCFCSFSQGYWFAKPGVVWPDTNGNAPGKLTIGSQNYTQSDGQIIWKSSNKGGIPNLKKAFLQFAAIKLSQALDPQTLPPALQDQMDIIESDWNYTVNQIIDNKIKASAKAAAGGWIGNWIDSNHCSE